MIHIVIIITISSRRAHAKTKQLHLVCFPSLRLSGLRPKLLNKPGDISLSANLLILPSADRSSLPRPPPPASLLVPGTLANRRLRGLIGLFISRLPLAPRDLSPPTGVTAY